MSEVDVEALKHSRRSIVGNVMKVLRKFQKVAKEDPCTYDINALDDKLTYLDNNVARFQRVHQEICDELTVQELDKEQEVEDTFDENVSTTKCFLNRFKDMKKAHELITDLQEDMEASETAKARNPEKDGSAAVTQLTGVFKELRALLRASTIPHDHRLRRNVAEVSARLNLLSMEDKPAPPPTIVTTTPAATSKTVQMPKMELPSFRGDLMKWATFWSEFSSAMASHPELTGANKLAYLHTAIKDPKTAPLMESGVEGEGRYEKVVVLLQRRFDKRRVIHSNYCRALASEEVVKATREEFNDLADSIGHNIEGLKLTGQYTSDHIMTSLSVARIPKHMQTEWELHTTKTKDVPPIDDFLQHQPL